MERSETDLHNTIIELKNQLTEYIHANKSLESKLEDANLLIQKGEQERKQLIDKLEYMGKMFKVHEDMKKKVDDLGKAKKKLLKAMKENQSSAKASEHRIDELSKIARENLKKKNHAKYDLDKLEAKFDRAIKVIEQQGININTQRNIIERVEGELRHTKDRLHQVIKQRDILLSKLRDANPTYDASAENSTYESPISKYE